MSFGKDNSHLANIPAFGGGRSLIQRAKTNAQRPARSYSGGGAPYWKGTYKPPMLGTDIIRIIPGNYVQDVTRDGETITQDTYPYFMFREHTMKIGAVPRGGICSAGPLFASRKHAQECLGCPIYWEDVRARQAKKKSGDKTKGPNRINMRDQFAYTIFDYGVYFEMPDLDRDGNYRMNPTTQQPYTSWEKGNPNDPKYQGRPWKQGMLLPWALGQSYQDVILQYADTIGNDCASCGLRGGIQCVLKMCASCGQPIYDPTNSALTLEQRSQIDNLPHHCTACGFNGHVDEVIACSQCQSPTRTQLWDVDLQVSAVGSKGQQTYLQIMNWSEARPIQVADPAVLAEIKPLDLAKKFAPTPVEVQAKIWNLTSGQPQLMAQQAPVPGPSTQYGPPNVPSGYGPPTMSRAPVQVPTGMPQQTQAMQYASPQQQPQQLPLVPPTTPYGNPNQ